MTDKLLFEEIRKLVKEQKERAQLDYHRDDFAQEYCRLEMLKKKQIRHREQTKFNNLFKNFQNVQSYVNIMDIINRLPISLKQEEEKQAQYSKDQLPQIIPKSIQMKIKEQLGPILNQKYEEQSQKRDLLIQKMKSKIDFGNKLDYEGSGIIRQMQNGIDNDKVSDKMEQIDMLRKDIKRKQVYFLEKKFDDDIKEIENVPNKIENTKLFHKICSYLHMILEQEHKEKWSSREDKRLREARRNNSKRLMRISGILTPSEKQSNINRSTHSHFFSLKKQTSGDDLKVSQNDPAEESDEQIKEDIKGNQSSSIHRDNRTTINQKVKKLQTTKELLKQNFTFRRRNIKAGLMVKINQFVDKLNNEEKRNIQLSKRYGKALQSLTESIKSSYSRFQRQEIAEDEEIDEMKKYLDNTLSRNKKDLKKFHHK